MLLPDWQNQPKWRRLGTIIFLVLSILVILITFFYFTILSPSESYERYITSKPIILKDKENCNFVVNIISTPGADFDFIERREFCLWRNIDYNRNNVFVCRVFTDGGLYKSGCYRQYKYTFESKMYFFKTEFVVFLSLLVVILFVGGVLCSKLGVWGSLLGFFYSFLANVITGGHCFSNCLPFWLIPPYKTMWLIIPSAVFAILGYIIERRLFSEKKADIMLS